MSKMERLTDVFRSVFNDETIGFSEKTTADDIPAWDSVAHISLIFAVEDEFGVRFSESDLARLKDVGDLLDIIERRSS